MAKNHWHSSTSKRAIALKYGYKSGLEQTVAEQIKNDTEKNFIIDF